MNNNNNKKRNICLNDIFTFLDVITKDLGKFGFPYFIKHQDLRLDKTQ